MPIEMQQVDVCIVCALEEEANAVEQEVSTRCQTAFEKGTTDDGHAVYGYRWTTIFNKKNKPLTLLLFCQTRSGPLSAALDLEVLLHSFQPRFVAMTGICAGDKRHVQLGDLVVAEYAYHYQEGKIEYDEQGIMTHQPEWITYGPAKQIIHFVRTFDTWQEPVAELERPDRANKRPRRLIAPMASGMTVQGIDPFPGLQHHSRKTCALDMEAAAFYQTLYNFPLVASLVVKGVSDYADQSKNDAYHEYAARASAIYLLSFIREYVTEETMPGPRVSATFAPFGSSTPAHAMFSSYLRELRDKCSQEFSHELIRPDHIYVPQYASFYKDADASSEERLLDVHVAAKTHEQRPVAVLGNYGMGKSYFTWHMTLEQISRYEQGHQEQIPILFPLMKFNYAEATRPVPEGKQKDIVGQILDSLILLDFPRIDRKHFVRWLEDGLFTLILDGLDELILPQTVSWQEVLEPLMTIKGATLLMTSRTSYIKNPQQDLARYDIFELLPWGTREWNHYLMLSMKDPDRDALLAALKNRPRLLSLTTRPLWCFMIVSIARRVAIAADLGLSGLYQEFLNEAMKRRPMPASLLTRADQFVTMECFAEECIRSKDGYLREQDLERLLSQLFQAVGMESLRMLISDHIRTYTFLNCDQYQHYNFGHKSFEDYFVSSGIVRWLAEKSMGDKTGPERIGLGVLPLSERPLSDEQMLFTLGILQEQDIMQSLAITPPSDEPLHTQIVLFLQNTLADDDLDDVTSDEKALQMRINMFRLYIELLRTTTNRPQIHVNGLNLQQLNLAGLNLAQCIFHKVDFTNTILSNTNFTGSSFAGCSFFGAIIDGADFSGADLAGANFIGVEKPGQLPIFKNAKGLQQIKVRDRERRFLLFE